MTPKAKAKQIFKKYAKGKDEHGWFLTEFDTCSKLCALIAVDEIINCDSFFKTLEDTKSFTKYWYKVQQEIKNL